MTPFKVDCPECATSLRISNPDHVGKNAKCPKCRTWLTIPQPPEEDDEEVDEAPVQRRPSASAPSKPKPRPKPAPKPKPVEDEFDSDFNSDEFDDLPVEPTPRKPAVKKKSKKRKSSKSSFDGGMFAKIGGGAAVVLVVLFIGLKFARPFIKAGNVFGWFDRSSGIGPDLAWLPDGVDVAGEIRVADLMKAPVLQQVLQRPDSAMGLAMMSSMVGFGPSDIESVRFGLFASPRMGGNAERFTAVVRLARPAGVAALLENAATATPPTATKATHGSRTIFTFPLLPQASLCCVDEQTILLGSNAEVRSVLDKEGRAESTSRFAFLDKARQLSVVVAPRDLNTASGYLGTASMAMFKNSPMTGMSFCGDLDSALHAAVLVNSTSSKAAQSGVADFDRGFKTALGRFPAVDDATNKFKSALMATNAKAQGKLVVVSLEMPADVISGLIASNMDGGPTAPPFARPPSFPPASVPTTSGFGNPSRMIPHDPAVNTPPMQPVLTNDAGFGTPSAAESPMPAETPADAASPFKLKTSPFKPATPAPETSPQQTSPFRKKTAS